MIDAEAVRSALEGTAGTLVGCLAAGEFAVVHNLTSGRFLTTEQLQQGLERLQSPLVPTPRLESRNARFVPIEDPPGSYSVVFELWTEHGRTDTGIELRLVPDEGFSFVCFDVEILGFRTVEPLEPSVELDDEPSAATPPKLPDSPLPDNVPERWRPILTSLANRLANGDYSGLEADGLVLNSGSPDYIGVGYFLEQYPYRPVELPPEAWLYSQHWREEEDPHDGWGTIVNLWTAEEGRSDLSMVAQVWDDGATITAKVEIVHVA